MNTLLIIFAALVFFGLAAIAFLAMIAKSYVKAPSDRAFVRTGGLSKSSTVKPKVVMNGGAWVFGIIHEITWVDLRTMEIQIERTGDNALLTRDPQYADIKAVFYIKVNPTVEGIIDAARTIGDEVVDAEIVKRLMDAKLDGALRDVAASFTLMDLHQQREKFIQEVQARVKDDLEENGLVLESVSISNLKAARQGSFGTDDVFGAQVARANAEVIQEARKQRNDIERATEVAVKERDTETAKKKLTLEQDLAFAAAEQEREVRSRQAMEKAAAAQILYEQEQAREAARIAKERSIKLSEIEMEQAVLLEEERKNEEYQVAEINRAQAIETARQAEEIAVFKEQQKREAAEKERLLAAALREKAAQEVKTVEEKSRARRQAEIQIIEAERDAERAMIDRKNEVEIEALKKVREAEARAAALREISQAELEAAQKQAETKRQQAQAESDAEKLLAEAERERARAAGLAEADIIRAKAEATRTEADVLRAKGLAEAEAIRAKELAEAEGQKAKAEALAAFDSVSQKLELERMQIDAQIQIGVARAEAIGAAIANMQIKMYGTPEAADSVLRLMSFADGSNDVFNAVPPQLRRLGGQLLDKLVGPNGKSVADANDPANAQPVLPKGAADMFPALADLAERSLNVDALKGKTIAQALDELDAAVAAEDKALVAQARAALTLFPALAQSDFEEVYKTVKNE